MDLLALLYLLTQVMAVRFSFHIDSKNIEYVKGIANQPVTLLHVVVVGLKFIAFAAAIANLAIILYQFCFPF